MGKNRTMNRRRSVYQLLLAFVIMLVVVSGCLYKQTIDYKQENRELILQNDSLRAVVIELTRKIDTARLAHVQTASVPKKK